MRRIIERILVSMTQRYLAKSKASVVVVSGSVGKTSTTQAIITVLSQKYSVLGTRKNYNSLIGVACSVFQTDIPTQLKNPFAWAFILIKAGMTSLTTPRHDVLVLEIGADHPGELQQFSWLKPDIAVVTAVAPEHMELFKTIEAVAREELAPSHYSDKTIVNSRMVDKQFYEYADQENLFHYDRDDIQHLKLQPTELQVIGEHSIDAVAAGIAVGKSLGMDIDTLRAGALAVKPQPGRMYQFQGIAGSKIIDDTYNSSPEAVRAALAYLQSREEKKKIFLMGNMNELGESSASEHQAVGALCNPKVLSLVITLGADANTYTAPAAQANGCEVKSVQTPYDAAIFIKHALDSDTVVLCKGSQNGVFAEEAVKLLLANPDDSTHLVRQSSFWQKKKDASFSND